RLYYCRTTDSSRGTSVKPTEIRAKLDHPVIDGDGHWLEPIPVYLDWLREVGGPSAVEQQRAVWQRGQQWYRADWDERHRRRLRRGIWWGVTNQTYDKATALLPALMNERLPELGVDFSILYPSFGLSLPLQQNDELRQAAARAYNLMTMDMF